jgi:MAF protein
MASSDTDDGAHSPRHLAHEAERMPSTRGNGSKRLVLASGSPRRRALVTAFDAPIDLVAPTGDEPPPLDGETPEQFVLRLSLAKAEEVAGQVSPAIVLGADTAVVLDGEILGKPAGPEDATRMLKQLRGRTHRVLTGVTVLDGESGVRAASANSSKVTMRRYSDGEVEAYVSTGEPFDKAGGYAIQDYRFHPVEALDGCYLNVVGLPLCEAATLLARMGASPRIRPDWRPPQQCRECPLQRGRQVRRP